eukprot:5625257-Prymnesium_polylepis.1
MLWSARERVRCARKRKFNILRTWLSQGWTTSAARGLALRAPHGHAGEWSGERSPHSGAGVCTEHRAVSSHAECARCPVHGPVNGEVSSPGGRRDLTRVT